MFRVCLRMYVRLVFAGLLYVPTLASISICSSKYDA